jgi:DNA polymerase-3 subunit delta'
MAKMVVVNMNLLSIFCLGLCSNKQAQAACGECVSCQWLKSDTHPNYVHITTDEDNKKQNAKIKIEKIRDLLPFVQQTVDGWRVIVIEPAKL